MQYWNDLYVEIAEKITANMPNIQWIDLWHEQVNFLTEELPFPTPAVFIDFRTLGIDDRGTLAQDCDLQINLYLFFETFSDTYHGAYNKDRALEFLKELTNLHALFHGKNGNNYSELRRTQMSREDSGGAGNLYRISFECLVTDDSAQTLFTETQNTNAEIVITSAKEEPEPPPEDDFFYIVDK